MQVQSPAKSTETISTQQRISGCLLGLALGDALGAPHEGGPLERGLWRLLGRTREGLKRYTDDTQMSMDLADSLVACGRFDPNDIAKRFAHGYRWSRGYGPGAAKVLKKVRSGMPWEQASRAVYKQGSWGNGGAMRAPVAALFHAARADAPVPMELARRQAAITHAHIRAQDGAALIASAVCQALSRREPKWDEVVARSALLEPEAWSARLSQARRWLDMSESLQPSAREVAKGLGNGILAVDSCMTAIYVAHRFMNSGFLEMLSFVRECGGDVDTIGAMAGAIVGAMQGESALPQDVLERVEGIPRLRSIADRLSVVT